MMGMGIPITRLIVNACPRLIKSPHYITGETGEDFYTIMYHKSEHKKVLLSL